MLSVLLYLLVFSLRLITVVESTFPSVHMRLYTVSLQNGCCAYRRDENIPSYAPAKKGSAGVPAVPRRPHSSLGALAGTTTPNTTNATYNLSTTKVTKNSTTKNIPKQPQAMKSKKRPMKELQKKHFLSFSVPNVETVPDQSWKHHSLIKLCC
jgi:hypothetical protein